MKRPFDAVLWWEIRRIPYNLILLVAGILALLVAQIVGSRLAEEPVFPLALPLVVGCVAYGIMANVFYTLSWITEIAWSSGDTSRTEALRSKIFLIGLAVSVILTSLPATLTLVVRAAFGFK